MAQAPVPVGAVWIRSNGPPEQRQVEVLVNHGRKWFLISKYPAFQFIGGLVSHIVEPLGIRRAIHPDGEIEISGPPRRAGKAVRS